MKQAALFLIIVAVFLVLPHFASSVTTFIIQETEKISLQANATDPDADKLVTTYAAPLNENGEWQTNYGDAGEYKTSVTVSDGITSDTREVLIIVKRKEEAPKIELFSPKQDALSIKEAEAIDFRILASDLNNDELSYKWFLDGKEAKEAKEVKEGEQEFLYSTTYNDAGSHKISVSVSDGASSISKEWDVDIANVDVESLLNEIKDINVNENEIARLKLPDFEKYSLSYSISEPLGNKNEWKTGYRDAGSYDVTIHAEGKGFSGDKTVKILVNDVDKPPIFDKIENRVISENEELKITLNANDPDDDEIAYSADNLPEGAVFEGNYFAWKPGYDAVKKSDLIGTILEKFRALSKSFYVQFAASSKGRKVLQNVIITVKDVNRAPVLEDIEPITITEGETLKIAPKAYDLDGDKISLSYSGFMDTDTFKSGFDDAGTYYAKVTASDGLLEASKFVQISIRQGNRAPLFGKIEEIKAIEGEGIAILLNANDLDGDEIIYSIDNPPEGSSIKGNVFLWTPSYNLANKKETKSFDLVFAASDGKTETRQIAKVTVADKNRAPKIIDASKSIAAKANEPALMFVKAVDDDGDEMTYTWDFGLLEKYKATATHQRVFTSKGLKSVKVTVSDGIDSVEHIINVNVA